MEPDILSQELCDIIIAPFLTICLVSLGFLNHALDAIVDEQLRLPVLQQQAAHPWEVVSDPVAEEQRHMH